MTTTTQCPGTRTQTGRGESPQTCPVCRRVLTTTRGGRIPSHAPSRPACRALVYRNRWPERCSRWALPGTRYCRQHTT